MGKIAVPDGILLKSGGLTEPEWEEMRRHPVEGYRLLHRIAFLKEAAETVHTHHEHYDGTGYPQKLKGEEIPLGARLFAVADVFDALTSDRPYHTAIDYAPTAEIIREKKGSHFDPAVVEVFKKIQPAEWEAIRGRYSEVDQTPPGKKTRSMPMWRIKA